jgi:glycosyltransferase involved in cell wall biosynthesis
MVTGDKAKKSGNIEASVIIPAYNEEIAIGRVLDEVQKIMSGSGLTYEIIVVDDGSKDSTVEVVKGKEGVKLVQHPVNRGYGGALKTGIKNASGEIILTFDADGTFQAREIPKLLQYAGEYDMVVGSRSAKEERKNLYRRPAKWFLTKLANYLSQVNIPDLNSGMRLFKKTDVERFLTILPSSFSFTTTLTLAYQCNEYQVKYIPVDHQGRVGGRSKISPLKDGFNFILLILRAITYFNPLRVFLPLAFGLFAAALLAFLCPLLLMDKILDATVVALVIAAIQVGALGLIADAIAKGKAYK